MDVLFAAGQDKKQALADIHGLMASEKLFSRKISVQRSGLPKVAEILIGIP
jgi:hypothetical protein